MQSGHPLQVCQFQLTKDIESLNTNTLSSGVSAESLKSINKLKQSHRAYILESGSESDICVSDYIGSNILMMYIH